jgi:putative transposase
MQMQILQAFRYELRPTSVQNDAMRRFAGSCRFVYNKGLVLQKELHGRGERKLGYAGLSKALTGWRSSCETSWLADAPVHPLQQALKDLERAYTNFFAGRAQFPQFRKRGLNDSFRYPDAKQFRLDQSNHRIFLPKLGWLRYRASRPVKGTVRNVTVSLSAGRWFVSIQTEREVERPVHPSTTEVGIDLGVVRFATLSNGEVIEAASSYKKQRNRLRKAQQSLSRKKKFSSNWKKAKARVRRVHTRIANVRRDFLHKTSTTISKNHAVVYVEDLKVRNMSRSAKGTRSEPGKNVRAKSGLNRAILDQGWSEFRRQLGYKLAWRGGELVVVPPHFTSQTCPASGHVSSENRRRQAEFVCVECGYREHADLVGAINVLRAGHARIACEVSSAVRLPAAGTTPDRSAGSIPVLAV